MGASIDARDLALAAAAGDPRGWDGLVERFGGLVWSTTRAYGLSPDDGADAAQTTWLRLAEQLGRLQDQYGQLGVWLAATARRESLRLLGAARAAEPLTQKEPPPPPAPGATPCSGGWCGSCRSTAAGCCASCSPRRRPATRRSRPPLTCPWTASPRRGPPASRNFVTEWPRSVSGRK